jgi:hypothetical protein
VPASKACEQVEPQSIPAGPLATWPEPLPAGVTVNVWVGAAAVLNVAVTVVSLFSVTVQVPVPEQPPPDQPANVEPEEAAAVSVT